MTAQEVITNIKNLKAGGRQTDDEQLSDAQYMFIIDYYRAMLIRQQQTQGQTVSSFVEQNLGYVEVEQSDYDDCLFETSPIPKPIELHRRDLITYVGDGDKAGYQRTTFNGSHWHEYRKHVGKLPTWYPKDNKVVVKHFSGIREVNVVGVFERPIDVIRFKGEYNPINPYGFEYPISSNMLDSILKLITDAEIKLSVLLPQDLLNDSTETKA